MYDELIQQIMTLSTELITKHNNDEFTTEAEVIVRETITQLDKLTLKLSGVI